MFLFPINWSNCLHRHRAPDRNQETLMDAIKKSFWYLFAQYITSLFAKYITSLFAKYITSLFAKFITSLNFKKFRARKEYSGHEFVSKQRVSMVGSCVRTIIPKQDSDAALLSPNFTHNSHYLDTRSLHYIYSWNIHVCTTTYLRLDVSLGGSWHWPCPSQEVSPLLASL